MLIVDRVILRGFRARVIWTVDRGRCSCVQESDSRKRCVVYYPIPLLYILDYAVSKCMIKHKLRRLDAGTARACDFLTRQFFAQVSMNMQTFICCPGRG